MKPASAKAKGRNLQNLVRDRLLEAFAFCLEDGDVRSAPMGVNGEDIILSPKAKRILDNTQWECKSKASFAVYKDWEQAVSHGKGNPVLVIKGDRKKPLAVVDLDYLITLLDLKAGSP